MGSMRRPLAVAFAVGLALTACGGDDDDASAGDGADGADPSGQVLSVVGRSGFQFDPPTLTATAGDITIELSNDDSVVHSLVVDGIDDFKIVDNGSETATFAAGEYRYWCDIPGHVEAGMEGTLTVS